MVNHQEDYLVVNIIENFLGTPKSGRDPEKRTQWEFNCPSPTCRKDQGKFNLAYNSNDKIFKCWKCKYSGVIYRLVKEYGSGEDFKRLKLILPEYKLNTFNVFKKAEVNYESIVCEMPNGFLPLNADRPSALFKKAYDYAVNIRKISKAQIDKYNIGYTEIGPRKFRIIFPSYNSNGRMNYFEARSYMDSPKVPYYKPDYPNKQDIIFNEKFINWDLPIYLVEGVFDALRIPNAIPMLGKSPSPLLIKRILENNATVIICLDVDAFKDGIEIYKQLHSLGINVFFIELKKDKSDKNKVKDISKTFEDDGQEGVNKILKTAQKIDTAFEINKLLNE